MKADFPRDIVLPECIDSSVYCVAYKTPGSPEISNLTSKFGQIGPKWDKSGTF